jgi:Fur family ferric uptake transcriptional regulator
MTLSKLEQLCLEKGMKLTDQRRIVAKVINESPDHPDVEKLYTRALALDPNISIATVYRTVRLFREAGVIAEHDFGDGRSRYEPLSEEHHDHLINIHTGEVIEFFNKELENLKDKIAHELGYTLIDHRLELYAIPHSLPKKKQK